MRKLKIKLKIKRKNSEKMQDKDKYDLIENMDIEELNFIKNALAEIYKFANVGKVNVCGDYKEQIKEIEKIYDIWTHKKDGKRFIVIEKKVKK